MRSPQRAPWLVAAAALTAAAFFVLPLVGLLWRAPWGQFATEVASPEVLSALRLSLVCSLAAVALSAVLGLPPVVGGVALLAAFGRRGLVGQWLDSAFGVRLPFSTPGVVLAETFVAMP